jgi:hypothetical protein
MSVDGVDPRIPAALRGARDDGLGTTDAVRHWDPLRYCIFTTIALMAWLVPAPFVVVAMAGLGVVAYTRAWRRGLRRSRCVLGDVRIVVAYLALALLTGLVGIGWLLFRS